MKKAKREQKVKVEGSAKDQLKKVKDYDYDHIDELGKMIGGRNFS
ncbi:MAG: hypothetical protein AABW55_05075 [Thermoproteota archaeon]